MFFCCQTKEQKGEYALEVFQTPSNPSKLSEISQQKSIVLKGYSPGLRSKVVDRMGKYHKPAPGRLDSIMNYLKTQKQGLEDFAMRKILKSDYEKLIQQYAYTDKKWTDPDFPPEQRSFGMGRQTQKVVWQRIDKIIKNPIFVGGGSIDPSDILQGRIGDCYFLSAIAGLAEKDSRIKNIFPNLTINKNGIYMARVLHKGVFREVVVDDYFPTSRYDKKLMGANPAKGQEIWVMILEKCWAKLYGSYEAIDGGLPNQVLHAFSAAPTIQYLTNESEEETDKLFNIIHVGDQREWIVCCGTYSTGDIQDMGLVQGHAYTILAVFDKPRRLVKIRNPWGERQWKGGASDSDKRFWNSVSAYDKKRLGHTEKDDGIFFMFWEQFLQYFQLVDVCKIDERANYYYQELNYPRGRAVYTTITSKGGEATIAITQESTRGKEVPDPRYAAVTLIIAQKQQNYRGEVQYKYVESLNVRNRCDINVDVLLQSGQYIVYSSLFGRQENVEATISCYCQTPIQMNLFAQVNEEDFLHRIFLDHAKNNTQNHQKIFGRMDVWVCMDIVMDSGFAYTVVHIGPSVKTKIGLTFNQDQYEQSNFELLPPFKGSGTFKIVCQSGQDSIVLCKIVPKNIMMQASLPIPSIKRLC